ncbi:MAG: hypothetical protein RL728_556 [Bacteroidota bacterium]|jgi:nicotinate-nucleotide adenylyltransferase
MKVGLFFGTFNPIHVGHLIIANHLATHTDLDQVWLVVTPQNPLKVKQTMLADHHRLMLTQIAVEENDFLRVSDIEFKLPKPNYTIDTLAYLKEKHPSYTFCLIVGEDNLRTFHKWKNHEQISAQYPLYIYPRVLTAQEITANEPIISTEKLMEQFPNAHFCLDAPLMKISSTYIRESIQQQKDVRYLLTPEVYKYVDEMNFYRK